MIILPPFSDLIPGLPDYGTTLRLENTEVLIVAVEKQATATDIWRVPKGREKKAIIVASKQSVRSKD